MEENNETLDIKQDRKLQESIAKQIQSEYTLSWLHQKSKKDEWNVRLKLYNNQKRDKDSVGDTTLFTIFQTILASLYVDRLAVEFGGREEGDEEVAENLNAMAAYDYDEMGKDETDYDWIWDTLFFGRGLLAFYEYERDADKGIYLPLPEVIDPIPFLRDPQGTSINGNRQRKGACRFFGSEVLLTAREIEELPHRTDTFKMSELSFGKGTKSLLQDAIDARDTAQGREIQRFQGEKNLGVNASYDVTRWYTHFKIGEQVKKVIVWSANERSKVVGLQVLKNDYWPVIDRPLYPTSHDFDGTSIPDLTEDKQRARAVAQNLGLKAMRADLYPMYIYDSTKILNRKDLNFGYNKFIPVSTEGTKGIENTIVPLIKSRPNMNLLDFIYNSLDLSAQKATATPEIQQGIMSEQKRTLGEVNIIASKVDTRYSLSAKVFSWSEKRFWRQWYQLYKDNFTEDIDEKVIRLVGAFGAKWRPLKKQDIVARLDPDIKIESKVLSRAQQLEERTSLTQYFSLALQEPTSNRRWGLKKLAKLNGLEKDEIDRLFPPTIDERISEDENEKLNKNQYVPVLREDDHNVHLEMHSKAGDTNATHAHIETHKKALSIKKLKPEFFPEEAQAADFQAPGTERLMLPNMAQPAGRTPSQTSGQPMM